MILSRGRGFTGNVPSENRVDAGVLSQSWRELPGILRIADGGMMRKFSWMLLVFLTISLWAVEGDGAENHAPLIICDVLSGSNHQF